jgi:hypothetical protein
MEYPIAITFKIFALAQQFRVTDATGTLLMYVKRKLFKLREEVTVFADAEQTTVRFTIKADRILDFNANYTVRDANGAIQCVVHREGLRSLWRATFVVSTASGAVYTISETNPAVKFLDGLIGEIPIVGFFTGYFLNPKYRARDAANNDVFEIIKRKAMLEGKYSIVPISPVDEQEAVNILSGIFVLVMLERQRG